MKPVHLSRHARERMLLRGAAEAEVLSALRDCPSLPAQGTKRQCRQTFPFGGRPPGSDRTYAFKTVHVIFADEPAAITVVTVLVYYGDTEAAG